MEGFKRDNLFPLILHCRGETSNTLGKQLYLLILTNLQLESRIKKVKWRLSQRKLISLKVAFRKLIILSANP